MEKQTGMILGGLGLVGLVGAGAYALSRKAPTATTMPMQPGPLPSNSGVMGPALGSAILIDNGGFELLNASNMPVGWTVSGAPALVRINPHGGANAMSTTSVNYLSRFFSCAGLRTPVYRLSAWHRTETAGTARMMVTVPPNGLLSTWKGASSRAWQKLEGTFTIPLGAERFGLLLQPSAGTVIWDDVQLERIQ